LRSIKAFDKFKTALPGFAETLYGIGDQPDLLEEFVGIVRDITFTRT
jgi:hypothetical protein